ncbi:MAG: hypothetical protein QOI15_2639 [Pseudonocardiales bacterium]|nr:hypothetical protein [Pseudonocardiales bacterium]
MTEARRRTQIIAIVGTVLVLAGLGFWALYVQASADEPHAYARGGAPPQYVRVEIGKTYRIAVRGGVATLAKAGLDPATLTCTAARPGEGPGALSLSFENKDTKATNDVASFVAAMNGRLHVECAGVGAVFVDNAEDSAVDWSGLWLVLASLALVVGTPLILSALRSSGNRPGDSVAADVGGVDPAAEEVL